MPVVFLIPTIIQFFKANSYTLYDYIVSGEDPNAVRGLAYFWLILFLLTFVFGIIDCVSMAMRKIQITQIRIRGRSGITNMSSLDDMISNITDIDVRHGVLGGAFGYGTIIITTVSRKYRFKNIKDADSLINIINGIKASMSGTNQS